MEGGFWQMINVDLEKTIPEPLRFPDERVKVAEIRQDYGTFLSVDALKWALNKDYLSKDSQKITASEIAPSLRCPEGCNNCPDSILEIKRRIAVGLIPKVEARARTETFKYMMDDFYNLGIRHWMFVGGTLDHLPEIGELINHGLSQEETKVSWFSDGIPQTNPDGSPSNLMQTALEDGWMKKVANHVSWDYPYGYANIIPHGNILPLKQGRGLKFEDDPEYSRVFKTHYGTIFALNLINADARRVVLNITVSPGNLRLIPQLYAQADLLQQHAIENGKKTEVGLTFSPSIWRPHQARGDGTLQSPASAGLEMRDMSETNEIFSMILQNEYKRIRNGHPRLLYNSSGYTNLMADPQYRQITVDQGVPYPNGPEILNITPTADAWLDPMFAGPELEEINSTFGYRDRVFKPENNIFTQFQDPNLPWFPNMVTT